jgi:hypothetical protein
MQQVVIIIIHPKKNVASQATSPLIPETIHPTPSHKIKKRGIE